MRIFIYLFLFLLINTHIVHANVKDDPEKYRYGISFTKERDLMTFLFKCRRLNLKLQANLPVLDVGTGCGGAIVALRKLGFKQLYAMDRRQYVCFHHNMLIHTLIDKIKFLKGTIHSGATVEISNNFFGLILILNELNYMPDQDIVSDLKRIWHILKAWRIHFY